MAASGVHAGLVSSPEKRSPIKTSSSRTPTPPRVAGIAGTRTLNGNRPSLPSRQRAPLCIRAIASSRLPAHASSSEQGLAPLPSPESATLPAPLAAPFLAPKSEAAGAFVHEFQMSTDSAESTGQLMLLRTIQRSTGLCWSATGAPASIQDDQAHQACFQLVPRKIRATSTLISESLADASGYPDVKVGSQVVDADWPLELAKLTFQECQEEAISISSACAGADDLDWVLDASEATALILLEPEESMNLLAVDSRGIAARAAERSIPVFRIGMGDHDDQQQAAVLPEAVRVLASLLSTGHRVHITCLRGLSCSPLVVLGYLTFFKGMEFSSAVEAIKGCCPGVSPSYAAWEQAKERTLAGSNMQRMTDLAHRAYQRRITHGTGGTSADDWKWAQRQMLMETLAQRVSGDVTMSHSLAQVQLLHAEEVAADKVKEAEERAAERTRVLARQVEELQKSRTEAAGAAASAAEQIQYFRSQVAALTQQEADARLAAAQAVERVALLTSQLEELTSQLEELRTRERDARLGEEEVTSERTEAMEEELVRMRQLNHSLAESLEAGEREVEAAEERAQQLGAELEKVLAMECASREMAAAMQKKAEVLSATVGRLEKRALDSEKEAQTLDSELAAARRRDEESQRIVSVLQERVGKLGKEASIAQDSLRASNSRVQFFFRVMNRLMEREKEAQKAAGGATLELANVAAEMQELKTKDVVLSNAWALAREKARLLCLQLDNIELLSQEETGLFKEGTVATPQAEAAREALKVAKEKETELREQLQRIQKQLTEIAAAGEMKKKKAANRIQGEERDEDKEEEGEEWEEVEGEEVEEDAEEEEERLNGAVMASSVLAEQVEIHERVIQMAEAQTETRSALVEELEGAKEELGEKKAEVQALKEQLVAAQAAAAEAESLKQQLAVAMEETRKAREAETLAKDKSEFLVRQLERLKNRMVQAEAVYRRESQERESKLEEKLRAAKEGERVAKERAAAAEERAEELRKSVEEVTARERRAVAALESAQERISFFLRRSQEQEQREERSKAALGDARKEVVALSRQMLGLKKSLEMSQNGAFTSSNLTEELRRMSADLDGRYKSS